MNSIEEHSKQVGEERAFLRTVKSPHCSSRQLGLIHVQLQVQSLIDSKTEQSLMEAGNAVGRRLLSLDAIRAQFQ